MPHSKILSQVFQVGSWCCKNKLDLLIELTDKTTSVWRRLKYEDDPKLKRSDLVYPARAYTTLVVLVCSLTREGWRRLCYELDLISFWTGIDLALTLPWLSLILSWPRPNLVYAVLFLEARASLELGLSVTESLGRSHFSSSTSQIKLIMVRSGKVTLRILRIILRVDWMVIGLVRRCLRMVRTILRII